MERVSDRTLDRTDILDMMGSLKLFGMRSAFDEIVTIAVKRQHGPPASAAKSTQAAPAYLRGELLKVEIDEKHGRFFTTLDPVNRLEAEARAGRQVGLPTT